MDSVRRLAHGCGAVLVVDEVSAGFRLNTGGAHLVYDLKPDVAVFSKSLGNGYPIAAVIGKADIMEATEKTFISSTYWTERIGPVAALAMIRKHEANDVGAHLIRMGKAVQQAWKETAADAGVPVHVSGIPPLSHLSLEVEDPNAASALFIQCMLAQGVLASASYYPMFAHTDAHLETFRKALAETFKVLAQALDAGDVRAAAGGQPHHGGVPTPGLTPEQRSGTCGNL